MLTLGNKGLCILLVTLNHIHVCGVFVKQVVFLTVNHRGPLPCGETLGDLEPVYDLFLIMSEFTLSEAVVTQTYMYVASL